MPPDRTHAHAAFRTRVPPRILRAPLLETVVAEHVHAAARLVGHVRGPSAHGTTQRRRPFVPLAAAAAAAAVVVFGGGGGGRRRGTGGATPTARHVRGNHVLHGGTHSLPPRAGQDGRRGVCVWMGINTLSFATR